ncbi:MAG: NAD(P)H-dependent oxidoreductase [Actinomycetota bacterium]|nr:NAD(P)H-dependent oxidoreductase [Actinomycetota bacterium]
MPERIKLAVLIGSTRNGRFGPTVAAWFVGQVKQRDDVEVTLLDLADDIDLEAATVAADAMVIVTPEYNHGYPGPLKVALDSLYLGLRGKPVAFVTYGGISGGLRAAEQLRLVLAELHAVTIRETVSFSGASACFTPAGTPVDEAAVSTAATVLLDQLTWWASALRQAKLTTPYPAP